VPAGEVAISNSHSPWSDSQEVPETGVEGVVVVAPRVS